MTISQVLALHRDEDSTWFAPGMVTSSVASSWSFADQNRQRLRAEREWFGAIAAMNALLQRLVTNSEKSLDTAKSLPPMGVVLSGDAPVLEAPELTQRFCTWVFTPDVGTIGQRCLKQLPPVDVAIASPSVQSLPLLPDDPLAREQFCVVLTRTFSLVMVLGTTPQGAPQFQFSFDPQVVDDVYQALRWRVLATAAGRGAELDALVDEFAPQPPDYRLVTMFSHLILQQLPMPVPSHQEHPHAIAASVTNQASQATDTSSARLGVDHLEGDPDVELLRAIAHEVRTPLATIRTLTRLALKQKNLPKAVVQSLQAIDQECTEQIDRFGLIFQAVELETAPGKSSLMPLATTSLDHVLQQSIPRWQQQAQRSSLTLEVSLPQRMPHVVSNPALLDQVLTSLVQRFTQRLPHGSHIRVVATLAGNQLKLQLESDAARLSDNAVQTPLKSIGSLLTFQPETGNLSLNLDVTKNLFQALGGKLIVRQRPHQGEVLTMFLPLDMGGPDIYEV
ncbi:MAG: HAMP domain-containing histidine kinase [Cyanobacteria bacterium]|nr:HAMP domain-containing histidine kinase [Cyanobacteriota bacterium]MDW8200068.1 HAMP domain-containing sensor histidine kinase [Cyanobacteriota bacterium SKYGB_h_bin112]